MKITDKQFNRILDKLKVTTTSEGDRIRFHFDNNYFAIEGYYDILSGTIEDMQVYIEDVETNITDEQLNKIVSVAELKIVELENIKNQNSEILKYHENGF